MIAEYPRTFSALQSLENLLNCSFCKETARNPCTLGGCEHIFCSVCCENFIGKNCPTCDIPAHAKDAQVNRQLFNIVTLCQKLRKLLTGEPDYADTGVKETHQNIRDAENNNQKMFQKTYNTSSSVYDLSSSSESETEKKKRKTSRRNNKNEGKGEPNRTSTGRIASNRKKSEAMPIDVSGLMQPDTVNRTPGTPQFGITTDSNTSRNQRRKSDNGRLNTGIADDDNEKSRTPSKRHDRTPSKARSHTTQGKGTQRRKSYVSNEEGDEALEHHRTHLVPDQTTMTQFFDYVDDQDGSDLDTITLGNDLDTSSRKRSDSVKKSDKPHSTMVTSSNKKSIASNGEKNRKVLRTRIPKNQQEKVSMVTECTYDKNERHFGNDTAGVIEKTKRGQKRKSSELCNDESVVTPKTPRSRTPVIATPRSSSRNTTPKNLNTTPSNATPKQHRKQAKTTPHQSSSNSGTKKAQTDPLLKKNAKGETLLQIASIKGDQNKVKELLQAGANPNTRDNAGWTPLHEAVHHGNTQIAELLLDHGAMINVPGVDNDTPLHDAVCNYKLDCVKLLVSKGASLTTRNIFGLTPLDCARTKEMKSALQTQIRTSVPDVQCVDVLAYQQPCLLGTFLSRDQKILVQKCAVVLQAKVVEEISPEVTHVILPCNEDGMCPRTIKYLLGVLTGKWIVNIEWINMCMDYGSRVCEEAFEIPGTSNNPDSGAANKGRMNRIKQLPGLFDGCQFYFHGNFNPPSPDKDELIDLVRMGGGHILTREPKSHNLDENTFTVPYHAEQDGPLALCCIYLVHDSNISYPAIKTARMCTVTPSWIMDCIGMFKLLDPSFS